MKAPIDEFFLERARRLSTDDAPTDDGGVPDHKTVLDMFDAQVQSRHLDFAARWLQANGHGYYTIGSAGHEANAAIGLISRVSDPALLHYRSGAFYQGRAIRHGAEAQGPWDTAQQSVRAVLLSLVSAAADPMSGGRHKVFGHPDLNIIPQTSTISSHLPRAVGLAFVLGALYDEMPAPAWPEDAIVICSFGDASVNHSTAQGALNTAAYLAHRGIATPALFVCEDNGIGISTKTPNGWTERTLRALPAITYVDACDPRPDRLLNSVKRAVETVRNTRRPVILRLRAVRFMGHAGSDVELGYRRGRDIAADYHRDPILATASYLVSNGTLSSDDVIERYESIRVRVMDEASAVINEPKLADRASVLQALTGRTRRGSDSKVVAASSHHEVGEVVSATTSPKSLRQMTLGQAINAALADVLITRPHALVFGEDVSLKGGVYGVTRGLRKRFGGRRVFDTLLDEQTILGVALAAGLSGLLPIPEIQYLAYLHNAEDQLRGEAASLQFFSDGQYQNPMVVRIAGLAYQKGFGGHFHNDNSIAVLRDIPGIVVCVPSHPQDAPALLRECVELAERDGRVCVFLEPIALYHSRDLYEDGDGGWLAEYDPPARQDYLRSLGASLGTVRTYGTGADLLVITFGNGVRMSLRAARVLKEKGIQTTVMDLRWLVPLPTEALTAHAERFRAVLVADETRFSGGVAESIVAALVDAGHNGAIKRVNSADSFVPLGPATECVLLTEEQIVDHAQILVEHVRSTT